MTARPTLGDSASNNDDETPKVRPFDAVILTGGASSRMGTDKSLLEIDGEPLVLRVARALSEATTVTALGGDLVALSQLGLEAEPDAHPGDGPLGGIAHALTIGTTELVVVVACDMPFLNGKTVRALVEAVDGHDAAVAVVDGHCQPVLAAWRRGAPVAAIFATGERSPRRALDQLDTVEVPVADARVAFDLDTPDDLTAL